MFSEAFLRTIWESGSVHTSRWCLYHRLTNSALCSVVGDLGSARSDELELSSHLTECSIGLAAIKMQADQSHGTLKFHEYFDERMMCYICAVNV